jgi:hypothetical protein
MSDFVQDEPDDAEELGDDEPDPVAPGESEGWEETNDEPAQGEGQQDIV